ncbi:MAG TPA: hypothetical protein VFE98_01665 [Candidatus Bathyarchaeia archaeon]|nr:hypothetical protein [Candidatus Bathyarchaeia archaeon]
MTDYGDFASRHRKSNEADELRLFERFHAADLLLRAGLDTYLDTTLSTVNGGQQIHADACGVEPESGQLTLVFCETAAPDDSFWPVLQIVAQSDNAKAIILSTTFLSDSIVKSHVPGVLEAGKVQLKNIGWFEDNLEKSLQETLRLIELLGNETRIRMMAPLFQKSTEKKELRARINPKLVYSNLNTLSEAGLVDESEQGRYELSLFGKTVLGEFIAFLEKTRRILDESKYAEVKQSGRR